MRIFGRGKDTLFYDLLEAQAEAAHRAAQEFHALIRDYDNRDAHIQRIEAIEHEGDDLTHQFANKLDATFITPLDKEDLNDLSSALDDVTDLIEAATGRIALYRLAAPRPDLEPQIASLVAITDATREAVRALANLRGGGREALQPHFIRIHEIENDHDQMYRQALADLFNAPGADPLEVIKWKEVYDRIEIAVDKCEDVAKTIESVVVKHA